MRTPATHVIAAPDGRQSIAGFREMALCWAAVVSRPRPRKLLHALAWAVGTLCTVASAEQVEERAFRYRTVVEAVAVSEKAETIANPLQWPMLMSVAPDGLFVEQGTTIAEFDQAGLLLRLENLQRDQAIVQAELEQTLVGLRNKEMGLNDEMEGLRDQIGRAHV